ncbi:FKBP-type peptidyl-prolyl cis-trans isomerase, partial [Gemmatimonadota bacterium]
VGLLGCGDNNGSGPPDVTEIEFAAELGVDLSQMTKTSSGLYYQDLVVGTGEEAEAGDEVTVHYTGWLPNGTQFDSSEGGDPATFSLNEVIQGWGEGVPGMKVGGKRKLVVPPHLGYGASGHPAGIPGNAVLVFDVELLDVL